MDAIVGRKPRLGAMVRTWMRHALGRALEYSHVPAQIKEFEYVDIRTNETVYLSTGNTYSVLHIGNRRFFFERTTGRFDGTCTSLEERVADGLELRN